MPRASSRPSSFWLLALSTAHFELALEISKMPEPYLHYIRNYRNLWAPITIATDTVIHLTATILVFCFPPSPRIFVSFTAVTRTLISKDHQLNMFCEMC